MIIQRIDLQLLQTIKHELGLYMTVQIKYFQKENNGTFANMYSSEQNLSHVFIIVSTLASTRQNDSSLCIVLLRIIIRLTERPVKLSEI